MIKKLNRVIIGSGFIAKKFKKHQNFLKNSNTVIYAAGISNSLEQKSSNLEREVRKVQNFIIHNNRRIIYISTYSINDTQRSKNRYVKNKIKIEKIIKNKVSKYLIIRLPELVGFSKNPYTLTNFFFNKIVNKEKFIVYKNTKRNLLDIDDAITNCMKLIKLYKRKNYEVNILNKKDYKPIEIVESLEKILKIKGIYKFKKIYRSNFKKSNTFYINLKKDYLNRILKKYYK